MYLLIQDNWSDTKASQRRPIISQHETLVGAVAFAKESRREFRVYSVGQTLVPYEVDQDIRPRIVG